MKKVIKLITLFSLFISFSIMPSEKEEKEKRDASPIVSELAKQVQDLKKEMEELKKNRCQQENTDNRLKKLEENVKLGFIGSDGIDKALKKPRFPVWAQTIGLTPMSVLGTLYMFHAPITTILIAPL